MSAPDGAAAARLIVALDLPDLDGAEALAGRLHGLGVRFKVGLELFCAEGPRAVERVAAHGGVFLDLKLHDIPETVRRAARAAAATGADLLTVHAAGGTAMLQAAVAGAGEGGHASVLAVTVLTSMDLGDLRAVGVAANTVADLVVQRAVLARAAGCHGVIASPREAAAIRAAVGPDLLIVTPGVRPSGAPLGDQKRVATAHEARQAGATAVVVGRPIRDAADPVAAAYALIAELD